ncbi:hypothetical protein PAXRUDRAFT_19813 [Paxillus rubicundulus Ve08.2h10]|uniref:Uncharacterized protein n=1 Tax=Paxillus rubicundulus Ve08.2h10 TaxID=930991 RepID=A0A0D0DBA6_9AGAM|nr:hypothetical protein PAXRUDRAFT_19813 [Paxillus rubicundulus Ve08.2h10]
MTTWALRERLDHADTGDLIIPVTTFKGPHGCTIITGSSLDGHSSVKSNNQPPSGTVGDVKPTGLLMQMVVFTLVCMFINLIITYFLMTLPPVLPLDVLSYVFRPQ